MCLISQNTLSLRQVQFKVFVQLTEFYIGKAFCSLSLRRISNIWNEIEYHLSRIYSEKYANLTQPKFPISIRICFASRHLYVLKSWNLKGATEFSFAFGNWTHPQAVEWTAFLWMGGWLSSKAHFSLILHERDEKVEPPLFSTPLPKPIRLLSLS